jgi:hypothetical protein
MTSVDLTPYWPTAEDWTGFLLAIVPAGQLPISGEDLRRRVREQIGTDPVLYDLVTATLAPPFEATTDWDRAFITSVVEAAMPDRHFFAPRGVIGVVVVAGNKRTLDHAFRYLGDLTPLSRLCARRFGVVVQADRRTGISQTSVLRIASTVSMLIETFDEQPRIAIAEPTFLDRVRALIEEHHLNPLALEPEPTAGQPAEQAAQLGPEQSEPPQTEPRRPGPALTAGPMDDQASGSTPITTPPPDPAPVVDPRAPTFPAVEPSRRLLETVMYYGAEIVTVNQRTPIQRLTRQTPTDADAMDELQRDGRGVGLVYLVFVPDEGVVPRLVAKRRHEIALALDQALASVERDATTAQPARAAVEVLSATNPVQKHGVLRMAGNLPESALPKVRIEYFSIAETVEPLLDAARRTMRALRARGVKVVSQHVVFLAAMRFPADEGTEHDWIQLLEHARVTWIDFSPPDRRQPLFPMPPSPFGLHVLTDKEDVVAVVKEQSGAIYRYAQPLPDTTPGTAPAAGQPAAGPPAEVRRRWPFGRRSTG